ncbi:MAG TPA: PE family protein [Mycobacterium sp.]|nr:PE family protein [Mycobacterium sp.]HUH71947.1 PE family protein [Mycobacterium sp.]
MSFVLAAPEALVTAASDLAGIGSTLSTASAAAAAPTTGALAAAADEVSTQVAKLFSEHGLGYQQLSAQVAAFHDQFVQALSAGGSTYAAAEANAAQTLTNAMNAPATAVLGHPLLGSGVSAGAAGGIAGAAGGALSNAVSRLESVVPGPNVLGGAGLLGSNFLGGSGLLGGNGAAAIQSAAGALLGPTGGVRALTAASALLAPAAMTNAALAPTSAAFGDGIKSLYNAIEPWVLYGFQLAQYAVGYLPWIGFLAPQITIFYYLFEPIVQSGLFNILDWLGGSITFVQGLNNFFGATAASINTFINNEINWFLSFLPPLPPLP